MNILLFYQIPSAGRQKTLDHKEDQIDQRHEIGCPGDHGMVPDQRGGVRIAEPFQSAGGIRGGPDRVLDALLRLLPAQISGQTVTVSGTTTGATVTVNNGGTTRVYNAVRRGDVDSNNSVNPTDYSRMRNTVSGTGSGLTENTAGYWAGDFDDDGSLDAFDLYYMDMYLNGNIDY